MGTTVITELAFGYPKHIEHPLFRAAMQMVVGVSQRHPQPMLDTYATQLRNMAIEHIHSDRFYEKDIK